MNKIKAVVGRYDFIIYPILFALFPLLSFYGSNASEIRSGGFNVWVFLIFNLVVALVIWLGALIICRDKRKASILATVLILVFFMFGRFHNLLGGFTIKTPFMLFGPTKILIVASIGILLIAWLVTRRLSEENVQRIGRTLLLVGAVMVATTLVSIVPSVISGKKTATPQQEEKAKNTVAINNQSRPDVYYILLDGYARADFLKNNFGLDNSQFLEDLRSRGFYLAEQANSNYAHTHFSVPSTFNMKYLNYLSDDMGEESTDRSPLRQLTQYNEVVPIFKSLGYEYVNIGSQWGWTMKSPLSDIELEAPGREEAKIVGIHLDEFALVYLQTTALKPWATSDIRGNLVDRILGAFEKTELVADRQESTLTFTHIVSPHPPYLFDENGLIPGQSKLELDNHGFSDRDKFADQTRYVNKRMIELIDNIHKNSSQPPIIIIASDHGPASSLGETDFNETDPAKLDVEGIKERMGILNAYYFPDQNYSNLYPTITPVNSFRLLLKQYYGQDIELLPDQSYFSNNKANEYRFTDVTSIVNIQKEQAQ